ncbi:MAG: 2,3,4,5-tetrahydropyridine-2,6-dicarboxylate N-succinyltransferase [Bacteriovoracaceae bacterium]|nr:2,3,4,5-tetrahydropyridine-2,6-dicarboxylate N-succinyltransferase [Bacteriovoracaceae bacterium]
MTVTDYELIISNLESGKARSASKIDGKWQANTEVKAAILEAFKAGKLVEQDGFVDKHNIMPQTFNVDKKVRIVPGGTSVRRGSFVAEGVIIMPPSYINIGAYVAEGTMVDSHVLVGSCAQIGKNVHLSAGVQIGGVLEPIGMSPVVIEDNAFIGAGSVIVEGIQVGAGAVIAPGVVLSRGVPIYDCINDRKLEIGEAIPPNAIVIPGSRQINPALKWGFEQGLHLNCAVIVKYRDEKSNQSLELESILR